MPSLTYCHDAHFDESNRSRITIVIAALGGIPDPEWLLQASQAGFWAENKEIWRIFC